MKRGSFVDRIRLSGLEKFLNENVLGVSGDGLTELDESRGIRVNELLLVVRRGPGDDATRDCTLRCVQIRLVQREELGEIEDAHMAEIEEMHVRGGVVVDAEHATAVKVPVGVAHRNIPATFGSNDFQKLENEK